MGSSAYVNTLLGPLSSDLSIPTPAVVSGSAVASLDCTIAIPSANDAVVTMAIISNQSGGLLWNLRINGSTALVYGGIKEVGATGTVSGVGSVNAAITIGACQSTSTSMIRLEIGKAIGGNRLLRSWSVDTGMFLAVDTISIATVGDITSVGCEASPSALHMGVGSTIYGNLSNVNAAGV